MMISINNNTGRCISIYDIAKLLSDDTCIIVMDKENEVVGTISKRGEYIDHTITDYTCPDDMHEPLHSTKVKSISTDDKMNIIIHIW